jgi:two-component system, OmpR family, alkaline phosphatase synthesis response regulator PhoP
MTKEKILIVEDEEDIRELIHFHLFKNKYEVLEASNGSDAIKMTREENPDLLLLDIMIPELDGIEVCKKLKEEPQTKDIKIIFLSAKGEEEDIVNGLELGADDYITKPFSPKVLMARIKTVLARNKKNNSNSVSAQGIVLNDDKKKVTIDNKDVSLTASEYLLLKHFISSPGHVFTRSQIVNNVKGLNHAITDRAIDTQLVSLRKKMGTKGKLIETVWGVGYRFKEHET